MNTIVEGFKDRKPSVHEFVLSGLLQTSDIVTHGDGANRISLGSQEPLASKLRASEPFAVQLIELSEMNSGILSHELYPTITQNFRPWGAVFYNVQTHVGISQPGPVVEAYLRKFTVDPETVPVDKNLPETAVAAARMLGRHTPEDLFARIYVRAIQNNVRTGEKSQSNNGGFPSVGGMAGPPPSPLSQQLDAWYGLFEIAPHAQSALPFMLEIIGHAADEKSTFNSTAIVHRADQSESQEYKYTANMRLFAFEFMARLETKNPAALDCLRAEFTRLIGQVPTDGEFELTPGRKNALLSHDVAVYSANDYAMYGGTRTSLKISPLEIELANSCILAWKAITGSNPRFATDEYSGSLGTLKVEDGYTRANMPQFVSHDAEESKTK